VDRYYSGEKGVLYYFQVIVKRRQEGRAMDECEAIADLLELSDLSSANGSYAITSCAVDTEPHEIELNESLYTVWETTMKALITTKGRTTL
ncbi:MAG: minor capsid protein, partial [Gordonibacter sp.]